MGKSDGGDSRKEHRRVSKRKGIEKQWRKGTARWQYEGEGETEGDTLDRRLGAPRQGSLVNTGKERKALVVLTGGSYILLQDGEQVLRARPRRSTTTENENATLVTVGDSVYYQDIGEEEAVITHVTKRESFLLRTSIRDTEYAQVLVANLDQIIITVAATDELLRPGLIDRYLVAAAMGGLEAHICINKIDLPDDEDREFVDDIAQMYRDIGYVVLYTSCVTGEGMDELQALLADRLSAFTGHSGVGKTSILNTLLPALDEKTADISDQSRRGMHTTTRSALFELPDGGFVADTPGIREFGLFQFDAEDLHTYFPEFLPYADQCRFPSCTHTHEPDCAVREAVEREDIHPLRYRNYLQILESEDNS
ncbi:MAG: ribosome small subunit-dependent GTPase A [Bacteroidetes bacterium]|nr:ribosome small subunit-dependent GTPase A [Bacteroidota bacterium]